MSKRTIWQAAAGLITEPSNKEWNEDELVAAEHLNWFFEQVENDISDLNDLAHIGSSEPTKNLKQLIVGSSGLYRGGTDEGGVSFYTAWNAKWTGSDWEEISDTQALPSLLVHDVTDVSQLTGISASEIDGNEWVFLRAQSVDASNVITWQFSPVNVGKFRDIVFKDRDNDDFSWTLTEDPSSGHLHFKHTELPSDIVFRQDGTIDAGTNKELLDGEGLIVENTTDGTTVQGTFDVANDGNIPDDATELLLSASSDDNNNQNNNSSVQVKHPSHTAYITLAASDKNTGTTSQNNITYPLENGQLDFRAIAGQRAKLEYIGWVV